MVSVVAFFFSTVFFLLFFPSSSLTLYYSSSFPSFIFLPPPSFLLIKIALHFLQFLSSMNCLRLEAGNKQWSTKGENKEFFPIFQRMHRTHLTLHIGKERLSTLRHRAVLKYSFPTFHLLSTFSSKKLWQNSCLNHECRLFPCHTVLYLSRSITAVNFIELYSWASDYLPILVCLEWNLQVCMCFSLPP